MKELTNEDAIKIIGEILANESLKLSQREHLLGIKAYDKLKMLVYPEKEEVKK